MRKESLVPVLKTVKIRAHLIIRNYYVTAAKPTSVGSDPHELLSFQWPARIPRRVITRKETCKLKYTKLSKCHFGGRGRQVKFGPISIN